MVFVNLTPHTLILCGRELAPAGLARCNEYSRQVGEVDGVPIVERGQAGVEGLPPPAPDTLFIVSMLVRISLPHRTDLASPGYLERDEHGKIVGARCLVMTAR